MPKVDKSDKRWLQELGEDRYKVLRQKATEPAFSGEYDSVFDKGTYTCAACGEKIFSSDTKFDAHCGWPSFYDALPGSVELQEDSSHNMQRVEVTCANCGGHLGHVFKGEGFETPTDQRYCVNSLSLQLKK